MARKPAALARELLRNFPKGRRGNKRRKRGKGPGAANARGGRANGAVKTAAVEPDVEVGAEETEPETELELEEPAA
jgi:hypothetical protein